MSRLRSSIRLGARRPHPLIGVVAGSGLVVRSAVEAEADLLMVLNAGLYRNLGTGSLASFLSYGNANDQTESLLREQVLPRAAGVPVVAGVFAADPTEEVASRLERLRGLGVEGIVNWPAIGFVDGQFREALEEDGLGVRAEAAMLDLARSMGFVTFGFALGEPELARFLEARCDALVLNLGLTRKVNDLCEQRDSLQQAITRLNAMLGQARKAAPHTVCLAFGGPITSPEDLEQVFRCSEIDGFAGGSVFERLPVQAIVASTVRRFKSVTVRRGDRQREPAFGPMIGRSPAIREVYDLIDRVARYDVHVCIEGETGTGKELVATQLHRRSHRASQPFITLNCGAIPDTLLESELFGHEKGAFTSADRARLGKFELAQRGTLFLDEIADLSPRGQVALLRAIQQREVTRIGGEASIPIDVRILAASNQPLADAVAQGRFREDLYYRLNAITIAVPPLRDRREDIPLLVEQILARLSRQMSRRITGISPTFLARLQRHAWPGNVRELEHAIGQAALREDGEVLEGHHFAVAETVRLPHRIRDAEPSPTNDLRARALQTLREARGNKTRAAAILGITRKTLYAWLRDSEQAGR